MAVALAPGRKSPPGVVQVRARLFPYVIGTREREIRVREGGRFEMLVREPLQGPPPFAKPSPRIPKPLKVTQADLSDANLPPGTQLSFGTALVEITAEPHLGCAKFIERFGRDAALFVNSEVGKSLNLRGINARVIQPGAVSSGSVVRKLQDT